jgi:hypothetical protein
MERGFLRAVEAVYDAASSPAAWARALARIVTVAGAKAGILLFGPTIEDLAPLAIFGLEVPPAQLAAGALAAAFLSPLDASAVGALISTKQRAISASGGGGEVLAALESLVFET